MDKNGRKTQIRRTEEETHPKPYANSHRDAGEDSARIRDQLSQRPNRASGAGQPQPAITSGSLAGGILSQLIDSELDRLGELKECIARYERELTKTEQRLGNLQALQRQEEEQRKINGQ